MDMKSVCSCVLVLSLQFVCGQYSNTPCPGVFDFVNDGQQVYGKITLRPVSPVSTLELRINFTVAAQLFNNYVGRLDAQDSQNLLQKYNVGQAVTYLVHFPVTSPLPKLTALTANGNTICYGSGDIPAPNKYVTTLSLQHTSYLEGGSLPAYNNFQHQPHTRPQGIRPQPQAQQPTVNRVTYGDDDAQIYNLNNIEPTWTDGNNQYYILNNSNQQTQPTQQYHPPTQQISQSKPTYEYDEPPAQVPSRRPVRPNTPIHTESVPTRPLYEPAPVTRPKPNDFFYSDQDSPVTASPNRENTPEPPAECGVIGLSTVPLIHNGDAYDRGELPWLVAIYNNQMGALKFTCGGTLVSDRHIISAAHCVKGRNRLTSFKDIVVKLGVQNLNNWSDDHIITRNLLTGYIHEEYNATSLKNDILMLTLDVRVKFNLVIRPACLWPGSIDLSVIVGRSGTVAGWGDQGVGGTGNQGEPRKVNIPIASTNDCRASRSQFHDITYDNTICAGDRKGSGPCVGDSGGGLYLYEDGRWRIRGVVSVSLRPENGEGTCNLNEYVVFTDTAKFLPWINRIIAQD